MTRDQLADYEGHEAVLRFSDGHVVRGRILHVDAGEHRDFMYDLLEVIETGPPEFAGVKPGITASANLDELDSFELLNS